MEASWFHAHLNVSWKSEDPAMREYWGSQFALDKYTGTNGDTYIWPLDSIPPSSLAEVAAFQDTSISSLHNLHERASKNVFGSTNELAKVSARFHLRAGPSTSHVVRICSVTLKIHMSSSLNSLNGVI